MNQKCLKCGYVDSGNEEQTCPKCGGKMFDFISSRNPYIINLVDDNYSSVNVRKLIELALTVTSLGDSIIVKIKGEKND